MLHLACIAAQFQGIGAGIDRGRKNEAAHSAVAIVHKTVAEEQLSDAEDWLQEIY
jgi:hypothetical protein